MRVTACARQKKTHRGAKQTRSATNEGPGESRRLHPCYSFHLAGMGWAVPV